VTATITVASPSGVAVTPDGRKVYVVNNKFPNPSVSVIDTATNKVIGSPILVGDNPIAFGIFIQPFPREFTGTPGKANCYGQSVSALVRQFHGLEAAAAGLEFSSVRKLQDAISEFCEA
jgi:YVTN family beta-propeller protein